MIKKYWGLALLFFLSFILFSFGLFSSTSFQGDLGRDLYEIAKISYGNFTLLGPKGRIGGGGFAAFPVFPVWRKISGKLLLSQSKPLRPQRDLALAYPPGIRLVENGS